MSMQVMKLNISPDLQFLLSSRHDPPRWYKLRASRLNNQLVFVNIFLQSMSLTLETIFQYCQYFNPR